MAKINKVLKDTVDKISKPFSAGDSKEIMLVKKGNLLAYYKELLAEINSHLEYESDLMQSKDVPDQVIVKFDLDAYIVKLHEYLKQEGLYKKVRTDSFHGYLVDLILIDEDEFPNISKKLHSMLYIGMFKSISENTNIHFSDLLKNHYLFLKELSISEEEPGLKAVFDRFKEYMVLYGISMDDNGNTFYVDKITVLINLMETFRIPGRNELTALFKKSNPFYFVLKLIAVTVLFSAVTMYYDKLNNLLTILKYTLPLSTISFILLFAITAGIVYRFAVSRLRKKLLIKTFKLLKKDLEIDEDNIEATLGSRYLYDFKKFK